MGSFLQTLISGQRGASLTFTKLCPPVLEPHLDEEERMVDLDMSQANLDTKTNNAALEMRGMPYNHKVLCGNYMLDQKLNMHFILDVSERALT